METPQPGNARGAKDNRLASPQEGVSLLRMIFGRRMLICVFTGFASGLPFYFLIQLVPAWLRAEGVSLREIGFFAVVQLPYVWKFLWAPLLDRYQLPFLGRRRCWMLTTQIMLLGALAVLGQWQPTSDLDLIMWLAVLVAFFSATQDIVLDAYRRELLPDEELGLVYLSTSTPTSSSPS